MRKILILMGICGVLFDFGAAAAPFDGAAWLRDPRCTGFPIINLLHRERKNPPTLTGPKNIHSLLRKEIELTEKPASALLAITGDDYYKFFINGYRVVQGPESGYPSAYPYYYLDVTEFLDGGVNCLTAHVFYQGLRNRVWNSADNRSGFMMALTVTYPDGRTERFTTDDSWRLFQLTAFSGEETIGYQTQFPEHIDMRLMPVGWRLSGFDAKEWIAPIIEAQDHVFVLQPTPPLSVYSIQPAVTKKLGKGRYFYDLGEEIVGHTRIKITGPAGHVITVRHGEELSAPDTVRFEMRANCVYQELPILSGGEDLIEFYDYRAFRYIEILDAPAEPNVWVDVRHHPFDATLSTFSCADTSLEDIWTICRNGVRMGSQGGFLDCPSREKGQYLGDAVITSASHLWLTADASLTRKALLDFAHSQQICPGMMAVAPGSFMQEIAEYSLQYPLMLERYYRMTGDLTFTAMMVDSVYPKLFGYFAGFENEGGLIEGMIQKKEKWALVDWPKNLRDDFDYEYAEGKANAVVNGFYYGALRSAARLEKELGRDGVAYDTRADRVAVGFAEQLADKESGLYRDAPGSKHSSLHANAIPLAFGLSEGADRTRMVQLIREKRLACGVYIAPYVITACFQNGAADLGYDLLTSGDTHSWKEMLRNGATTCMEAWGPDQKDNASWCHPWSSSPLYLIAEQVFGVTPAEPGWTKIRISPAPIENLPAMTLRAPLPDGFITIRYTPGEGYRAIIPDGVSAEINAPAGKALRVENRLSHRKPQMNDTLKEQMNKAHWDEKVGADLGLLVSVPDQMVYLIRNGYPVWQARCATGAAGVGSLEGSLKTPPGWHRVLEKLGEGAPWGLIFRSRAVGKEVWKPGDVTKEDLVLTRVFCLDGLEPGLNKGRDAQGRNVDSNSRCIYIHGTNGEDKIGTPSSHGCVRLLNDDVIALFDQMPVGTPVYIAPE